MAPYGKTLFSPFAKALTTLAFAALAAHCGGAGDESGGEGGDGAVPRGDSASGGAGGASNEAGRGNPFNGSSTGGSGTGGSGTGGSAGGGETGGSGPGGSGSSGGEGGSGPAGAGGEGGGQTGLDEDADGIDDGLENTLARRFAPVLRLTKSEQYLPGSVAWYLPQVHMRFNHNNCPDHEIIALGKVTIDNLSKQNHQNTGTLCGHSGDPLLSNAKHLEFFLQPPDDKVHDGAPPADWRVYAHVKKSKTIVGGYDVQYWFFYPFNSTIVNFDHEADWEHITVITDASEALQQARYAAHAGGTTHPASALEFVPGTPRPVGYVAIGSHATYNKPGEYETQAPDFVFTDHADGLGPEFDTSVGLVNVGERGKPLNGQSWVNYGGRWGEIGQFADTSGPPTPSFQASWDSL